MFRSVRRVLGDDVFLRLHPDWRAIQAEAVRSSCTDPERDVLRYEASGFTLLPIARYFRLLDS